MPPFCGSDGVVAVVCQWLPETRPRLYFQVPPGLRVLVNPIALPSAQATPLFAPVYWYVICPPVGSVTDASRPVEKLGLPGVASYWKTYEPAPGTKMLFTRFAEPKNSATPGQPKLVFIPERVKDTIYDVLPPGAL